MKQIFEMTERTHINAILDGAEYGTLVLSVSDEPYAVPVNFVRMGESTGGERNRKNLLSFV